MDDDTKAIPRSPLKAFKAHLSRSTNIYIPIAGLIAVLIFFAVLSKGQSVSSGNISTLVNQSTIMAIAATGAVFIFSLGMLDISLGAICCVAAIIAVAAENSTGSMFVMFIVCMGVSIAISGINGLCIGLFKLPSFIVTLAMMNILTSLAMVLLQGKTRLTVPTELIAPLNTVPVKIIAVTFMLLLSIFFFEFRKLGRQNKILGGNPVNAVQSGVNPFRNTLISFLLCGVGIGLAAFMTILRTGTVTASTASSLGFDVIVGLVLGGMPISGGAKSRITAGIVGSVTITALNNGLIVVGVPSGMVQMVRGILFLVIVSLMVIKNRPKNLV